jgi:hypothetical protein
MSEKKINKALSMPFCPKTLKGEGIENQPPFRGGAKGDFQKHTLC